MESLKIPEVVKALRTCANGKGCDGCPYAGKGLEVCNSMMNHAADLLEMKPVVMSPKHKAALSELVEMMNEDENNPLTLDELRKMGSNPIWISEKGNESQDARSLWQQFAYEEPKTGIIALWEFGYEVENEYKISDYGKTWIAYASKPEGAKTNELE